MRRIPLAPLVLGLWGLSLLLVLYSVSQLRADLRRQSTATAHALDTHTAALYELQRANAQHETQLGGMRHLTPTLDTVAGRLKALDAREAQHYRHFLSGSFASR